VIESTDSDKQDESLKLEVDEEELSKNASRRQSMSMKKNSLDVYKRNGRYLQDIVTFYFIYLLL